MRKRNDKEKAEQYTPKFKNTNPINTKSLLQKKRLFKDVAVLPSHSFPVSYHTASYWVAPRMSLILQVHEAPVTIFLK